MEYSIEASAWTKWNKRQKETRGSKYTAINHTVSLTNLRLFETETSIVGS